MDGGDVRYAENAGINIAYQVFGEGPRDLIFVCGTMSHLELWWAEPLAAAMLDRLARFSRVILFDKPGTGLSDPVPGAPTVEQRTADVVAVMDAAGSERAVVIGFSEGGFPAITLAATQPERVEALVLLSAGMVTEWTPDVYTPKAKYERFWAVLEGAAHDWGKGTLMAAFAPSWVANPVQRRLLPVVERACMSPAMAKSVLLGIHNIDLRETAKTIRVPTLVAHANETMNPIEFGIEIHQHIAGSQMVELAGDDHLPWVYNWETFPAAVEEFLTGVHTDEDDENQVMTTIVFTDIVGSTERIAQLGDSAWSRMLAEHDRRVDELLERYSGVAVTHTGDGRMTRFARPARALRFANAVVEAIGGIGLEVRSGVHTGECTLQGDQVFGLSVNIAARIAGMAEPGEVRTSSTVRDLVIGSGLSFTDRGTHELRGVPGEWTLVACTGDRSGSASPTGYETDVRHASDAPAPSDTKMLDRLLVRGARHAPKTMRALMRTTGGAKYRKRASD